MNERLNKSIEGLKELQHALFVCEDKYKDRLLVLDYISPEEIDYAIEGLESQLSSEFTWHSLTDEIPVLPEPTLRPVLIQFLMDNGETMFGIWNGSLLVDEMKHEDNEFLVAWKYIDPYMEEQSTQ